MSIAPISSSCASIASLQSPRGIASLSGDHKFNDPWGRGWAYPPRRSAGLLVDEGFAEAGAATGSAPPLGATRAVITYDTTTATITRGITFRPSDESSNVARSTDVRGKDSMVQLIAPMPIANAGTSGRPGRCDAAIPPAAPMNIAGNTGPPRKLDSDKL